MKYLILGAVLALSSCGKDTQLVEVYKAQDFEGMYLCNDDSQIELVVDYNNRVTFETSNQSLNSVNPKNNTLGTHPVISERDLIVVNNRLITSPRNYNYSSSTHDLEEDISGSNITGNKRTDLEVKLSGNTLGIKIKIFAGAVNQNINSVIVQREFTCTK